MSKKRRQKRQKTGATDDMSDRQLAEKLAHLDENAALVSVQLAEAAAFVLRQNFGFTAEQADQALKLILDRAKARRGLFNRFSDPDQK